MTPSSRGALAAGVLAAAILAPAVLHAQAGTGTRPCMRGDVIGTWILVRMRAARGVTIDRTDHRYFQHQRFVFEALGGFRHLTSIRPFTPATLAALLAAPSTSRWSFGSDGRITIKEADGVSETVACEVVTRRVLDTHDNPAAMPGDVLLTSYDGDRPVLRRQLVPPPDAPR